MTKLRLEKQIKDLKEVINFTQNKDNLKMFNERLKEFERTLEIMIKNNIEYVSD